MAKNMGVLPVILAVSLVLLQLSFARAGDKFVIKGRVYCDNCHAGFPTRISPSIAGAKLAVRCRNQAGTETVYTEGVTDENGEFNISVKGEHDQDLCEAVAISSPTTCNIKSESNHGPVFLTHNNDIISDERITGPFAFKSAQKNSECSAVMAEYNY